MFANYYLSIATELRLFRIFLGDTITAFARRMGVSQATVSSYETGVRPVPDKILDSYVEKTDKVWSFFNNRQKLEEFLLHFLFKHQVYSVCFSKLICKEIQRYLKTNHFTKHFNVNSNWVNSNWKETKETWIKYTHLRKFKKTNDIYTLDEYFETFLSILHMENIAWYPIKTKEEDFHNLPDEIYCWPPHNLFNAISDGTAFIINNTVQLLDLFFFFCKSFKVVCKNLYYSALPFDIEIEMNDGRKYFLLLSFGLEEDENNEAIKLSDNLAGSFVKHFFGS